MRICGVDLTGNDAVIGLLFLENQQFIIPECRVRKLTLPKDHTREELQQFQFTFAMNQGVKGSDHLNSA